MNKKTSGGKKTASADVVQRKSKSQHKEMEHTSLDQQERVNNLEEEINKLKGDNPNFHSYTSVVTRVSRGISACKRCLKGS
jgi:hypothetical protein